MSPSPNYHFAKRSPAFGQSKVKNTPRATRFHTHKFAVPKKQKNQHATRKPSGSNPQDTKQQRLTAPYMHTIQDWTTLRKGETPKYKMYLLKLFIYDMKPTPITRTITKRILYPTNNRM